MKQIIFLGLILILAGCVQEIIPLETNIQIVGNPLTFHTEFDKGNNSINITIKQEPSRLIYFPIDYELLNEKGRFKAECFNNRFEKIFERNLTKIWFEGDYREIQIDYNTIIKYAILGSSKFDINSLNYTWERFSCRIKSDFGLRYIEYIDGVMVENTTNHCDWFWYDFDFKINCEERCEYIFLDEWRDFFISPSIYIMNKCYKDWSKW